MMFVKMDQTMRTAEGSIMRNKKNEPLTLKDVCAEAVLSAQGTDPDDAVTRWNWGKTVASGARVELSDELLVHLENRLQAMFPVGISGQAIELLRKGVVLEVVS